MYRRRHNRIDVTLSVTNADHGSSTTLKNPNAVKTEEKRLFADRESYVVIMERYVVINSEKILQNVRHQQIIPHTLSASLL